MLSFPRHTPRQNIWFSMWKDYWYFCVTKQYQNINQAKMLHCLDIDLLFSAGLFCKSHFSIHFLQFSCHQYAKSWMFYFVFTNIYIDETFSTFTATIYFQFLYKRWSTLLVVCIPNLAYNNCPTNEFSWQLHIKLRLPVGVVLLNVSYKPSCKIYYLKTQFLEGNLRDQRFFASWHCKCMLRFLSECIIDKFWLVGYSQKQIFFTFRNKN